MNPRTQRRIRIASAETYLTVPTSIAWAVEKKLALGFNLPVACSYKRARILLVILTIISKPVAKVDSCHVHLIELLSASSSGHNKGKEGIFDIAMAPCISSQQLCKFHTAGRALTVETLNLRDRSNISCAKGMSRRRK